jgi:hypothetical protein
VADVWLVVENLCKRRYAALDVPMPQGPDSHARVLADFAAEPELGGRLDADLLVRLKKYLAFRHRFIHGYGQEITRAMVDEPLCQIPETVSRLVSVWARWLEAL